MINSNFFISLLLLLLNYSKTFCQSNNTTFLVSVKGFDYIKNNIRLCLNRSDIYPNGICFQEKVILKKNTSLSLNVSEPFYCYAELMIGDSVVASTNGFIVTNTTINILFDNTKKNGNVIGGENTYYDKHRTLLFDLPSKIANHSGFNCALLKSDYRINTPDIRLQYYLREYENNILDEVKKNSTYYTILQGLINVKECLSLETLEKCLASLTDTLKKTKIGKEFATYIKNSKNLLPGQQVPTFFVKDFKEIEYKSDTLHSNTKYTIIDFWASWCTPCRVQMKELKKIYSSLDTSKVQIISISIDTDKENWLKACKEEDILWKSYYDSGGWYGEVSKKFNLTYIPQNRIIGLSGKIVAFDLGMEELHSFLEGKNLLNN